MCELNKDCNEELEFEKTIKTAFHGGMSLDLWVCDCGVQVLRLPDNFYEI